ncbi:hypothetical protein CNMCM7691_005521 [Aspergillus felis]|uniref:C2H2-type domain-containing protein n=1 Tax=Aspergillus felis TaxID=1287682 RepID=A0A8H6QLU8_9EURO|nr:hypothetical protein CNMCM7691_005521 [Aspergillus felis]
MTELPDFLASFTHTSPQNTSPEGLPDTQFDFDALLYNQSNVVSYNLSFHDNLSSLFSVAVPSESQLGGSIQPPANQMPTFGPESYTSPNAMANSMGGFSGRTDHHHSVVTAAHSSHLNGLAGGAPAHLMVEPAEGKAAVTSNETAKRIRSPVNEDGPKCEWKGCKYKRSFNRKEDLLRHVRTVHIFPGLHICPIKGCYKRCNREDNLKEHINRCHGKAASVEDKSE